MNAQRRVDAVLMQLAGTTAVAMVVNAPLVAAVAAVIAAVYAASKRDQEPLAFVSPGFPSIDPTRPTPSFRPEAVAFHGFEGDDALLHDVSDEDEEPDDDERSDAEQVVDHLTADLGEDDDDISFLPPYASGKAKTGVEDPEPLAVIWEPAPDSKLLQLLNDVLEPNSKMQMPRRFALGTVAILRNLLQPGDVERILAEQHRYPRLRFGDAAVQLGFLSESELEELLAAQEEGVFTEEEIRDTRARLQAYHVDSERRESA